MGSENFKQVSEAVAKAAAQESDPNIRRFLQDVAKVFGGQQRNIESKLGYTVFVTSDGQEVAVSCRLRAQLNALDKLCSDLKLTSVGIGSSLAQRIIQRY